MTWDFILGWARTEPVSEKRANRSLEILLPFGAGRPGIRVVLGGFSRPRASVGVIGQSSQPTWCAPSRWRNCSGRNMAQTEALFLYGVGEHERGITRPGKCGRSSSVSKAPRAPSCKSPAAGRGRVPGVSTEPWWTPWWTPEGGASPPALALPSRGWWVRTPLPPLSPSRSLAQGWPGAIPRSSARGLGDR